MNLFDGRREESVVLDSSAKGLLIGPGLWREMHDFSPDCVLMVFADAEYDEADYIRDRQEFIHHVHYGPPMTVRCALIDLPTRRDERGALAFVETGKQLPFEALRQFHLFDLRAGVARGGHAHKTCHQFLIASAGSFRVTTDDGKAKQEWILCSPAQGLHVPPDYWVELVPDSDSAVLSVLASHGHDESDYFRDRDQFIRHAAG
jgi:dTDP-4-dehydrorhamnose 3,5-epimerase-like enzyme